jgi:hypothetical protein
MGAVNHIMGVLTVGALLFSPKFASARGPSSVTGPGKAPLGSNVVRQPAHTIQRRPIGREHPRLINAGWPLYNYDNVGSACPTVRVQFADEYGWYVRDVAECP